MKASNQTQTMMRLKKNASNQSNLFIYLNFQSNNTNLQVLLYNDHKIKSI